MSAHTPGPWQLLQSNPERDGADCWTLLSQPHPSLRGFTQELAILAGPQDDPTAAANARLIAAAPDLLEALHSIIRIGREVEDWLECPAREIMNALVKCEQTARAAVAKAGASE